MPLTPVATDVNIHYEDSGGAGRPVVLIHGWPLSSRIWEYQAAALVEAGFRVITYDRRGFGSSDAPLTGYGYDRLSDDLADLMERLDLRDATLVGLSMGGGEAVRYVSRHGEGRLRSVVLASAVTPFLLQTDDNPEGPIKDAEAARQVLSLSADQETFYDSFVTQVYSAGGRLRVTEAERRQARAMCLNANRNAAVQCMAAFEATDFREDLQRLTVPTLVLHGDSDATVPFECSGRRTHEAVPGSELVLVAGGPHGINVSHADRFNEALLSFLSR